MVHPETITLPARRFVGLSARVNNSQPDRMFDLWRQFGSDETMAHITGKASSATIAVYTEYESDYTGEFTMLVGYELLPQAVAPAGLRVLEVPPQKYAVLLAQGEQPQAVQQAWQWVWASALNRSYTVDFDEYLAPHDVRVHVALRDSI